MFAAFVAVDEAEVRAWVVYAMHRNKPDWEKGVRIHIDFQTLASDDCNTVGPVVYSSRFGCRSRDQHLRKWLMRMRMSRLLMAGNRMTLCSSKG